MWQKKCDASFAPILQGLALQSPERWSDSAFALGPISPSNRRGFEKGTDIEARRTK